MGHLCGAVAGLLVGLVLLENRKVETWEVKLKIVSVCLYLLCLAVCLLWHLVSKIIALALCNVAVVFASVRNGQRLLPRVLQPELLPLHGGHLQPHHGLHLRPHALLVQTTVLTKYSVFLNIKASTVAQSTSF